MSGPGTPDRRRNVVLRELLDEVIQLARHLSRRAPAMSESELSYARERLEWLAEEIFAQTTELADDQP